MLVTLGVKERSRKQEKRAKSLQQHIEKDYRRVQNAVETLAQTRDREHMMERELRAKQEHMAVALQRMQLVERRVADLEHQVARGEGRGKYQALRRIIDGFKMQLKD